MKTENNTFTLEEIKVKHYGKPGTPKRDKLNQGYMEFKFGAMIQGARLERGMTQEELVNKRGTNKAYIWKVKNNIKDIRMSAL